MKKNYLKVLNVFLFIFFLNMAVTGAFRNFIPSDIYRLVHRFPGYLLILTVFLHLILNRKWIQTTYFRKK